MINHMLWTITSFIFSLQAQPCSVGRLFWLTFLFTALPLYAISYRIYNLVIAAILGVQVFNPLQLLSMFVLFVIHAPFLSFPAILCESSRYIVHDFNRALEKYLKSQRSLHPVSRGQLRLESLSSEYGNISDLLDDLNEFLGIYLLVIQTISLPTITILLYVFASSTIDDVFITSFVLTTIETVLIAVYNIWFPTRLNEEVCKLHRFLVLILISGER